MQQLIDIVRQYVSLPASSNRKGWYGLKCRLCGDYKVRGAFKFDHDTMAYNCFNCAHAAIFSPSKSSTIPDKMKAVLDAYGIPESEFNELLFKAFAAGNTSQVASKPDPNQIQYNKLELPPFFRPLITDGSGDVWDELACDYLINDRGIDPTQYPFMVAEKSLCRTKKDPKNMSEWDHWKGRVIVPYYRNQDLVFYQGRDVMNTDRTKYLSPSDSRDAAFYGFDEIYKYSKEPLYVQEGFFDAFLLKNSVATFSNKLTSQQIQILNRCSRPKVVIPDRQGKGDIMARQALHEGWSVAFPDIGSDCKDINDGINKYGHLYILRSIVDNTLSDFAAEVAINTYCKK